MIERHFVKRAQDRPRSRYIPVRLDDGRQCGGRRRFIYAPGAPWRSASIFAITRDTFLSRPEFPDYGYLKSLRATACNAPNEKHPTFDPLPQIPKMSVGNGGRFIEFERVKDWWGGNRPVAGGRNNFDVIRNEYYCDRGVAFEGFTAKNCLFREEFTARVWTSRYHFPAVRDERVEGEIVPGDTPSGARDWFINTPRRVQGSAGPQGARLRLRLEWSNKSTIHGLCQGTHSVFQSSDMTDPGKPSADELELLGPLRGKVPDEVFGAACAGGLRRLAAGPAGIWEPAIATRRGLATA
jgi:hypothetical protein